MEHCNTIPDLSCLQSSCRPLLSCVEQPSWSQSLITTSSSPLPRLILCVCVHAIIWYRTFWLVLQVKGYLNTFNANSFSQLCARVSWPHCRCCKTNPECVDAVVCAAVYKGLRQGARRADPHVNTSSWTSMTLCCCWVLESLLSKHFRYLAVPEDALASECVIPLPS